MPGDPLRPVFGGDAPFDATAAEIESRAELDSHLAKKSLADLVVLGLRLDEDPPDLTGVDVRQALFIGCTLASDDAEIDLIRRGAHVIPPFDERPYPTHPATLYTPDDLAAGFESGHAYGKALRTVKSCVGSTWCRYGVQDSVAFAIRLENRYKGLRSPHKLKSAVSGCARECAEAQSKDFGIIATEKG